MSRTSKEDSIPLAIVKMVYRMVVYVAIPAILVLTTTLPLILVCRIGDMISRKKKEKKYLILVAPQISRVGGYESQIRAITPFIVKSFGHLHILSNIAFSAPQAEGQGVAYSEIRYQPPFPRSFVCIANGFLLFLLKNRMGPHVYLLNFAQSKFSSTIAIMSKLMGHTVFSRIASSKDLDIITEKDPEQILIRSSLRFSDRVLCLNAYIWHKLRLLKFKESRLLYWKNAVGAPEVGDPVPKKMEGTAFKLIYAGRLDSHKGIDRAIRAFALVRDRGASGEFHIYGDGDEKENLMNIVRSKGLSDVVLFMGVEDISMVMGNYDCAILLSNSEGQSNFLLEAMARGVPVIASNVPGNEDLIVDGENGFLVNPHDADEAAQKLEYIVKDRKIASDMGKEGAKYVRREHSPEKIAAMLVDLVGG